MRLAIAALALVVAVAPALAKPDKQAPTVPQGLTATTVAASQIALAWQPSTDNVGVVSYRLERCQGTGCTSFLQIASPSGTTWQDGSLASATTYRYRVRACDARPNCSAFSAIATATTPGDLPVVLNVAPIVLTGTQQLVIDHTDYTLRATIELHDDAQLVIRNGSIFRHLHDYSGQHWLKATERAKVIVENSTLISSSFLGWTFVGDGAELRISNSDTAQWLVWHGILWRSKAVIAGVPTWGGTVTQSSTLSMSDAGEARVEVVFDPGAVIDTTFPAAAPATYTFPPPGAIGVGTAVTLARIAKVQWWITYRTGTDVTIRDTRDLSVSYSIPEDVNNLTAEFDGLRGQLYTDQTWLTGNARLRLVNTTTTKYWAAVSTGGSGNVIRLSNSDLADLQYSLGDVRTYIDTCNLYLIVGKDHTYTEVRNSVVYADVVARDNAVIDLINTTVHGQIVREGAGVVNVR